jgi:hypothetical protein
MMRFGSAVRTRRLGLVPLAPSAVRQAPLGLILVQSQAIQGNAETDESARMNLNKDE